MGERPSMERLLLFVFFGSKSKFPVEKKKKRRTCVY